MVMGVIESTTGTISETKGRAQATPEVVGKTPETVSKVSPIDQKLYSQTEADALVHAARSEAGREKGLLEKELGAFKKQVQTKDDEITANASEIEKLQANVDDLASDDPAKFDAVRELKTAREERRQLKADRSALEAEKQTYGETVQLAQSTLREISIWELATEYETGDPVKLKDLCDTFEAKSDEQIRKVADTLWVKKAVELEKPAAPPLKPYSGKTSGGGTKTESEIIKDYANDPNDPGKKQAYVTMMRSKRMRP